MKNREENAEVQEVNIGFLYFFDDYVVTEFHEGVHIDNENFDEARNIIKAMYGDRPFGFIAHRKNSYSLNLTDAKSFNKNFPTLKAYAVVCNTLFGNGVFEIENQFFQYNRKLFKNLESAIDWVTDVLIEEKELL